MRVLEYIVYFRHQSGDIVIQLLPNWLTMIGSFDAAVRSGVGGREGVWVGVELGFDFLEEGEGVGEGFAHCGLENNNEIEFEKGVKKGK